MNYLSLLTGWFKANHIASQGRGPFSATLLSALRKNECMRCGQLINDHSLLGNSMVVEKSEIVIVCRKCRGGGRIPSACNQSFGRIYLSSLIDQIDRHTCSLSGEKLDWHEVLMCSRGSYAFLQPVYHRPAQAFTRNMARRVRFGELLSISNCGECGAFWSNDHSRVTAGFGELGVDWNQFECWHCRMPHELQWHMRTTKSKEEKLLFGT